MKKTFMLILALVIAISLVTPAFAQDDESILIYPPRIPVDENGDRVVEVLPSQVILLGARWGACSRGLAKAFSQTADVSYEIDGQPIFMSLKESRQYWSQSPFPILEPEETACVNNSDTYWWVYWEYELESLGPGDHPAHFDYWNDHLHHDGGDYDGDGKPDMFRDWGVSIDFIIRVVE